MMSWGLSGLVVGVLVLLTFGQGVAAVAPDCPFRRRRPPAERLRLKPLPALCGADLSRANLAEARLPGVNLAGADLTEANLDGARLTEANLDGADLTKASLIRADLFGAELKKAKLSGANLTRSGQYNTDGRW